ncbi:hypothetical protein Pla52n_18680 [Stieleria varia]|uniref:Uncharacterized protein n=1 Tax=Stieleria varia TaxID=2528005 RepID=A0A5C6B2J0_9BACT|nr:hypothetical protein Pla52n_18680 [Stieleria varia]
MDSFLRRDKLDGRSFESEKGGSNHVWKLEMGGVKLVVGFSCATSLGMDECWMKQRFSARPPHPQPFSPRKAGGEARVDEWCGLWFEAHG